MFRWMAGEVGFRREGKIDKEQKRGKREGIRENEISRGAHETVGLNVGQLSKIK